MVVLLFMVVAAAEEASTAEKTGPTKPVESSPQSASGIQDLFLDSPSVMPPVSEKPKKDVKNDIMSLFEKVYALHYLKDCYELIFDQVYLFLVSYIRFIFGNWSSSVKVHFYSI